MAKNAAKKAATVTKTRNTRGNTQRGFRFCSMPASPVRRMNPGISRERFELIVKNASKWVNGTTLHYYFFDKKTDGSVLEGIDEWRTWVGNKKQMDVVRKAFRAWKALGIGLNFVEVKERQDAEIRIGFMEGDGSWSYLGRDVLQQPKNSRTMNFGW